MPPDLALCLYRVIQESLHNVGQYSGSKHARVQLHSEPGEIRLTISDTGSGFGLQSKRAEGGLGLSSMQERVRLVHGSLALSSEPGRGTRIEVRAPFQQPEQGT